MAESENNLETRRPRKASAKGSKSKPRNIAPPDINQIVPTVTPDPLESFPNLRIIEGNRGRKAKLSMLPKELLHKMLLRILGGAYDHAAAATIGIHPTTFRVWMQRGSRQREGIYRDFYEKVHQAKALVRTQCEIQVRQENPQFWLTRGPGRSRPEEPGWTDDVPNVIQAVSVNVDNNVAVNQEAPLSLGDSREMFQLAADLGLITINNPILLRPETPNEVESGVIDAEHRPS